MRQAPRRTSCWNEYQLEKAYQQSHKAAASGLAKAHSPYPDDVLNAAFEAGFADAVAVSPAENPSTQPLNLHWIDTAQKTAKSVQNLNQAVYPYA